MTPRFLHTQALCVGALAVTLAVGCKPERQNVAKVRQAEAKSRAAQAESSISGATVKKIATGGLNSQAIPPHDAAKVVAEIGSLKITVGDVARQIAQAPPHIQARYATLNNRKALLERMVQFELLVTEALARKLDETPRVRAAYKHALAAELLSSLGAGSLASVTDEEVSAYFAKNETSFGTPERRRAALLVVGKKDHAEALRIKLQAVLAEAPLTARQVFGDWVQKRSIDKATRMVKGDLGFFDATGAPEGRRLPPPGSVIAAVFSLAEVGDISPVVVLEDGTFALLQLTGLRPAVQQTLDDARIAIRGRLLKERGVAARQALIDDLMKKVTVTVDEKVLGSVKPPAATKRPKEPAGVPLPNDTNALRHHLQKRLKASGAPIDPTRKPAPAVSPGDNKNPTVDPEQVREAIDERKKSATQNGREKTP